jgi:predicted ATPase/DNA-binding SARP family transcriptional activator/Tfp pilus assembly protein PilF
LLALRLGHDVSREWLANSLWPGSEPEKALYNLRRCLNDLRQALGAEAETLLSPARLTIRLNREGVQVDVDSFDRAVAQSDRPGHEGKGPPEGVPDLRPLQEALSLYQGPLLEDCPEEWALSERRAREQRYLAALEILTQHALAEGETASAIRYLRKTVEVDGLREETQRALMQALFDAGDTASVTRVYRDLQLLLQRELNAGPAPETEALYWRLRKQARKPSPLATPPAAPGIARRLPVPLTALIGRELQIEEVIGWLKRGRLVTILGAGGMGKTRLAIAVGEEMADQFADGAWFVELAALSDPERVAQAVATTLGLPEQPGRSALETLIERLAARSLLLILDNCEHLAPGCALLTDRLLPACNGVHLLATSRHPLGSLGERGYRLLPLEMPPEGQAGEDKDIHALLEYPGLRLFVERAVMAQPRFRLSRQNAATVLLICQKLDGIPLAIELAAARLRAMDVERLSERLRLDLTVLALGHSTYPHRHRAMNAVIDWSYSLLTEPAQALFRRLSVFTNGCTLEAVEAVCGPGQGTPADILDGLTDLVDGSLVEYTTEPEGDRYRMLQPIQSFARAAFDATSEAPEILSRYLAYYVALVEEAPTEADPYDRFNRFDRELDNLRAALTLSQRAPEWGEQGLRLGAALCPFWRRRGYLSEGRETLTTLLAHPGAQNPSKARATALKGGGVLAQMQGDYTAARALFEQSLAMHQELGERPGIAETLGSLGTVAFYQGDYAAARALYEQSLTLLRELRNRSGVATALHNLAMVATNQGDYASARSLYEQSLAIKREAGEKQGIADSLNNLGTVVFFQGDYAAARALFEESLTIQREMRNRSGVAACLSSLGMVAYFQGDYAAALFRYEQSLAIQRELGEQQGIAETLGSLGNVAYLQGDYTAARALYEQCLAIQRELGNRSGIAATLSNLGMVTFQQGDTASARSLVGESLVLRWEFGDKWGIANSLESLASLAHKAEAGERAARLWGAASALREAIGSPVSANRHEELEREAAAARQTTGEAAFTVAWQEGQTMTLEQAVGYALYNAEE